MNDRPQHDVLLVDDDEKLGQLLERYLLRFGHRLRFVATGRAGRDQIRRAPPNLVILDVMLPDADGIELCRMLRQETDLPILMLTARGEVVDRVLGLEAGADDYLPKPFEPRELVARIESVLRRRGSKVATERLVLGDLALDPATRQVELDDVKVDLTTAEFELLHLLMSSAGRVLTRETLLDRLPHSEEVLDRAIDMTVSRLRNKLGEDPQAPRFVRTVRGVGYQFVVGEIT